MASRQTPDFRIINPFSTSKQDDWHPSFQTAGRDFSREQRIATRAFMLVRLLFMLGAMFVFYIVMDSVEFKPILASLDSQQQNDPLPERVSATTVLRATPEEHQDAAATTAADSTLDELLNSDLNRCAWIEERLKNGKPLGVALPSAGKGGPLHFWNKIPLLHTANPETGEEIMILKYGNRAKDPMHATNNFRNALSVLTREQGQVRLFPKLHGFCSDIHGFYHLAVEFIDTDVIFLPKPKSLDACVERGLNALQLFAELDETHNLVLGDIKAGQWMARADGSLVLQDVDDIFPPGTPMKYLNQAAAIKSKVRKVNQLTPGEMKQAWDRMFPRSELSARYSVVHTKLILGNLGFKWEEDCQASAAFLKCKRDLERWAMTVDDTWPSPRQVHDGLRACATGSGFARIPERPAH